MRAKSLCVGRKWIVVGGAERSSSICLPGRANKGCWQVMLLKMSLEKLVCGGAVDEVLEYYRGAGEGERKQLVCLAAEYMKRGLIYAIHESRSVEQVLEEKKYLGEYGKFLENPNNHYVGGKRNGGRSVPVFRAPEFSTIPDSAFMVAFRQKDMLTVKLLCALSVPTSARLYENVKSDKNLSGYVTKLGDHMYRHYCVGNPKAALKFSEIDGPVTKSGKKKGST